MFKGKKHLFFDLDDTMTATRSLMENEFYDFYASLPHDIIVISGAELSQINTQLRDLTSFRLAQNGNHAIDTHGNGLWQDVLSDDELAIIHDHIGKIRKHHKGEVYDENDIIENRGSQVAFSLVGHHAPIEMKRSCDPDRSVRMQLLRDIPIQSDVIEINIGGSTSFDYFKKGRNKGYNVKRLIDHMGWNTNECIYFGDALMPGCNDETVVGVIDTCPVDNHHHTLKILKEHFA